MFSVFLKTHYAILHDFSTVSFLYIQTKSLPSIYLLTEYTVKNVDNAGKRQKTLVAQAVHQNMTNHVIANRQNGSRMDGISAHADVLGQGTALIDHRE